MSYTITKQGHEQIVLIKISNPWDFRKEVPAMMTETLTALGDTSKPFFIIYDIRDLSITFDAIVGALTHVGYQQASEKEAYQKYSRMIVVGGGTLVTVGVKGAERMIPGSTVKAFHTPEEAIEYARAQLAKSD